MKCEEKQKSFTKIISSLDEFVVVGLLYLSMALNFHFYPLTLKKQNESMCSSFNVHAVEVFEFPHLQNELIYTHFFISDLLFQMEMSNLVWCLFTF